MDCACPVIGDAPDIGELEVIAAVPAAEFQAFGVKFIIWPLFAAIVANICGSDIVVKSSHVTPPSIMGIPENPTGAMARSNRRIPSQFRGQVDKSTLCPRPDLQYGLQNIPGASPGI